MDNEKRMSINLKRENSNKVLWIIFDLIFGFVLPIICFLFETRLGRFASIKNLFASFDMLTFFYGCISLEIVFLVLWLTPISKIVYLSGFISGVFLFGSFLAFSIGIILLPISLCTIPLWGIGLLGLVPFFTSYVFFRHGKRAFCRAKQHMNKKQFVCTIIVGLVIFHLIPLTINTVIKRDLHSIIESAKEPPPEAISRLIIMQYFVDLKKIVIAYTRETNNLKRGRLKESYFKITGVDIEELIEKQQAD